MRMQLLDKTSGVVALKYRVFATKRQLEKGAPVWYGSANRISSTVCYPGMLEEDPSSSHTSVY